MDTQGMVSVDRLGDINFGLPEDLAPHRKPWAYYGILGVDRTASSTEIKTAVRTLARKYHPDRVAQQGEAALKEATERQKLINDIAEILLDDGGDIGIEYSKRTQYDRISQYGEFFGSPHIERDGERTNSVCENLLDILEIKRRGIEGEHRLKTEDPELYDIMERLHDAVEREDSSAVEALHESLLEKIAAKEGITVDELKKRAEEARPQIEEEMRKRKKREEAFTGTFSREIKEGIRTRGRLSTTQRVYDIWYNGKEDNNPLVFFGIDERVMKCEIVGHKETDSIVNLGLMGYFYLAGLRKVHFKAEHANVIIRDAYVEGIFQIVHGKVTLDYEGSSYGAVIRVRAPTVTAGNGFARQGDLYVPIAFRSEGFEYRQPVLDIAVMDGSVDLRLRAPEVQRVSPSFKENRIFGTYNNLESYLSFDKGISNISSNISNSFNKKNNF